MLPRAEAYGASKAALSHFLESLRLDLAGEGIDISLIHPGFVKTPLTDRNDFPMPMRVSVERPPRPSSPPIAWTSTSRGASPCSSSCWAACRRGCDSDTAHREVRS